MLILEINKDKLAMAYDFLRKMRYEPIESPQELENNKLRLAWMKDTTFSDDDIPMRKEFDNFMKLLEASIIENTNED